MVTHRAYRAAQVASEPFLYTSASIGEGTALVIGPCGDKDPGSVLADLRVAVTGGEDLLVGRTLTEALSSTDRYAVPASSGTLDVFAEVDQLVCLNVQGSGGATAVKLSGARTPKRNSKTRGGHPGHGEFVVRATPVANDTVSYTVTAPHDLVLTACKTYSKTVPSGSSCRVHLEDQDNANLLSGFFVDATGLTTVTLQSHTLTATSTRLVIGAGETITIRIVGGAGLTPGDLLVALAYTLG